MARYSPPKAWVYLKRQRARRSTDYETEADALFARMTTPPSSTRKAQINSLIEDLKGAGVWSKLDALYVMAAHEAQAAQRNWVADERNLTPTSSTFTVDRGYAGGSLATGAVPNALTKYTQNSAHLAVWVQQATGNGAYFASSGSINILIPSGTDMLARINKNSGSDLVAPVVTQAGHILAQRVNGTTVEGFKNGISAGTAAQASAAPNAAELILLNGGAHRLAAASIGAGLTSAEALAFYEALSAYISGVGA